MSCVTGHKLKHLAEDNTAVRVEISTSGEHYSVRRGDEVAEELVDTDGTASMHLQKFEDPAKKTGALGPGNRTDLMTNTFERSLEQLYESQDAEISKMTGLKRMNVAAYLGQRLDKGKDASELIASAKSSSRAEEMFYIWDFIRKKGGDNRMMFLGGDAGGVGLTESEAAKVVLSLVDALTVGSSGKILIYQNLSYQEMWKALPPKVRDDVIDLFGGIDEARAWATQKVDAVLPPETVVQLLRRFEDLRRQQEKLVNAVALERHSKAARRAMAKEAVATVKELAPAQQHLADGIEFEFQKEESAKAKSKSTRSEWTSDDNSALEFYLKQPLHGDRSMRTFLRKVASSQEKKTYFDMRSRFTFTNAVEMLKLLIGVVVPRPIHATIYLVSNAFHLPRAQYIFNVVLEIGRAVRRIERSKYIKMYQQVLQEGKPSFIEGEAASGHNLEQLQNQRVLEQFFLAMQHSEIEFKARTVEDKENPSTVYGSRGSKLLQLKGIVFKPQEGHRLTADETQADLLDGKWYLSTDLEQKSPRPAFTIEGGKFKSETEGDYDIIFTDSGFRVHSVVYVVEAIGIIASSDKQYKRVTNPLYPVAKFRDGSYEFDGDYCKLNPDIWKNSNALNRLETIDWNLRMMIPRSKAYGVSMHDTFMETWANADATSWCDDELINKGGMKIPESAVPYVEEALEAYVRSAIKYFRAGEKLSGPPGVHKDHIVCPQVLAALPQHCKTLLTNNGHSPS